MRVIIHETTVYAIFFIPKVKIYDSMEACFSGIKK